MWGWGYSILIQMYQGIPVSWLPSSYLLQLDGRHSEGKKRFWQKSKCVEVFLPEGNMTRFNHSWALIWVLVQKPGFFIPVQLLNILFDELTCKPCWSTPPLHVFAQNSSYHLNYLSLKQVNVVFNGKAEVLSQKYSMDTERNMVRLLGLHWVFLLSPKHNYHGSSIWPPAYHQAKETWGRWHTDLWSLTRNCNQNTWVNFIIFRNERLLWSVEPYDKIGWLLTSKQVGRGEAAEEAWGWYCCGKSGSTNNIELGQWFFNYGHEPLGASTPFQDNNTKILFAFFILLTISLMMQKQWWVKLLVL